MKSLCQLIAPGIFQKILLVVISFLSFIASNLSACSCALMSLCESMEDHDTPIVLEGTIFNLTVYDTTELYGRTVELQSAYLQVERYYKNTIFATDTLKIYGDNRGDGACGVDLFNWPDYVILGISEELLDPYYRDTLNEPYTEIGMSQCFYTSVSLRGDFVSGYITDGFYDYPLNEFRERLADCSFNEDDLLAQVCADDETLVYPNPSPDGWYYISRISRAQTITYLAVYNTAGQLVLEVPNGWTRERLPKFQLPHRGIYYIRFRCNQQDHVRKIIYW